jgi:uncharacterized protein with HEPN domain
VKRKSPTIFLQDILQAIDKIERFTRQLDAPAFEQNELVIDAVLRNLAVIGEAARNVPAEVRTRYPHIPWRRMIGLRNIVIHEYFGVDLGITWQIISVNLPETKPLIEAMLQDLITDP